MAAVPSPRLVLHTSFRSSSSARLRIALRLKGLTTASGDVEEVYISLLKKEQNSAEYRAINPRMSVPVLQDRHANVLFPITQSVASLEYLEEVFPDRPALLPPLSDPIARAKVRTLVNLIVADIQPFTQVRTAAKVTEFGGDSVEWDKHWTTVGFKAFEETLQKTAGKYCVGDSITLADACLAPAVWNWEKFGQDLSPYPIIKRVYESLSQEREVIDSHWKNQPDTPQEFRQ